MVSVGVPGIEFSAEGVVDKLRDFNPFDDKSPKSVYTVVDRSQNQKVKAKIKTLVQRKIEEKSLERVHLKLDTSTGEHPKIVYEDAFYKCYDTMDIPKAPLSWGSLNVVTRLLYSPKTGLLLDHWKFKEIEAELSLLGVKVEHQERRPAVQITADETDVTLDEIFEDF